MNLQTFQDFMEERRLRVAGKAAYGQENDYPVMVSYTAARQWNVTVTAETDDWKTLRKELKNAGIKGNFSYADHHISFLLVLKNDSYRETYAQAVAGLTTFLRQNGVRPPIVCGVCGQPGCDALCFHKGGYDPVHRACMEGVASQVKEKAEDNRQKGNYFTGLVGALLGALVGVLPSFLTVVLVQRIHSLLFALIPLCIYWGYKLFRGRMNKAVIFITIPLSVLAVYLLEMMLLVFSLVTELEVPFVAALQLLVTMLPEPDLWSAMTSDALTSFLFVALGIWIAWGQITRTAQSDVRTIEDVLETVSPYGPVVSAAARQGEFSGGA